jgi:chromosome segregation ATPase
MGDYPLWAGDYYQGDSDALREYLTPDKENPSMSETWQENTRRLMAQDEAMRLAKEQRVAALESRLAAAEQQAQKAEDLVAKLTMQLFDMSLQSRENRKQAQTLRTTLIAAHRTLTYILMNEAAPIEIKESRIRRDLDLIDAALNPSFPEKDVGASEELSIERATKELIKRGKDMIESSPKS